MSDSLEMRTEAWWLAAVLVVSGVVSGAADPGSRSSATATLKSGVSSAEASSTNRFNPAGRPGVSEKELSVLTQVASLRRLSVEEAKRRHPVRLTGVLTYHDDGVWTTTFVQDATGGVYLEGGGKKIPVEFADESLRAGGLRYGQRVEVTGFSDPGGFAPFVVQPRIRVLGPGTLPEPKAVPFDDLTAGQEDGSWLELEGIVHAVRDPSVALPEGKDHVWLDAVAKGNTFRVWLPNWYEPLPVRWIDAKLRLRGVCGMTTTLQKQRLGVELLVPALAEVLVVEPAPEDPFAKPALPINSLLKYSPETTNEHRIKVRGVVLHHRPGRDLFVRDDTQSLRVLTLQTNRLEPGDVVEVVGFAESGVSGPFLEGAAFRRRGRGPPPPPRELAANGLLDMSREAELVQLTGRLISRGREPGKNVLMLQSGDLMFSAEMDDDVAVRSAALPEPGSLLRLRGIQLLELEDFFKAPHSFRLLLRSPGDIVVLQRQPWWNARRAMAAVGTLAVGFLGALLWIKTLRRRVEERTRELRGEIEERKRMQQEVDRTHQELMRAAHQSGMAEVATSVIHNVGNVLNSLNVSASLVCDHVRQSRIPSLGLAAALMRDHAADLGEFITRDPKGKCLPRYLEQLAEHLRQEQDTLMKEVHSLRGNVEHIMNIVVVQQNYARTVGMQERVSVTDLVEDALRINADSLTRHGVEIVREYEPRLPEINVQKHKLLQILVNLIRNANYACVHSGQPDKRVVVRVGNHDGTFRISVIDNGVGIPAENLTRIFNYGFTTRKDGHGFGLHSAALTAKEMGGALKVRSEGPGKGAAFTLELPVSNTARPAS